MVSTVSAGNGAFACNVTQIKLFAHGNEIDCSIFRTKNRTVLMLKREASPTSGIKTVESLGIPISSFRIDEERVNTSVFHALEIEILAILE